MSDRYITLLGSEQVQAAANTMTHAADRMQRAAEEMNHAADRTARVLDDFLIRLQSIMEKTDENRS